MSKRPSLLILLFAGSLVVAACNPDRPPLAPLGVTTTPVAVSHGGPAENLVSLVDALRAAGLAVTPSGTVSQPFLSVGGFTQSVNGETIQIYEYASPAAAEADAKKIAPNGSVEGMQIAWIAPPHFYRTGRILVIYPGTQATVLAALEGALGLPFAVGPGQ